MAARGVRISTQKISEIWRNPFYCGVLISRILKEPVKGNWPALVSRKDFIQMQQLLEQNHSGYQHAKDEVERPLTRILKCNDCGSYMVGYKNKKRGLHYYRCRKCTGVCMNADTTAKSRKKGAPELFIEFLDKHKFPAEVVPYVRDQLSKFINRFNEDDQLNSRLQLLERKVKDLKIRHGLGEVDKETYDLTFDYLSKQIMEVNRELENCIPKKSNIEKVISKSLAKLRKTSAIWTSGNLDSKRRTQKILFPEGIFYDAKKHEHLTPIKSLFIVPTY